MKVEVIAHSDAVLVRRAVLEPGEATPWHTDACRRFSVVLHGQRLRIERRDGPDEEVTVEPGMSDWDEPQPRVHRAVNAGDGPYEEIVVFLLPAAGVDPQPEPS